LIKHGPNHYFYIHAALVAAKPTADWRLSRFLWQISPGLEKSMAAKPQFFLSWRLAANLVV